MAETTKLDKSTARRIILAAAHGFPAKPGFPRKPPAKLVSAAADIIQQCSWIQLDTISVVERAHHHSLWSRLPNWNNSAMAELYSLTDNSGQRRIFEYWSHAAALLPSSDLPFAMRRMERIRREGHDWMNTNAETIQAVLSRIRDEGPFSSRDFEAPEGHKSGWWNWKPAKMALEKLFQAGEILVLRRDGFQKVFDVAERILPGISRIQAADDAAMAAWYVDRAIRELGIFSLKDLSYARNEGIGLVASEIQNRLEAHRLIEVNLEGGKEKLWLAPEALDAQPPILRGPGRIEILSPFDPFVINRSRLKRFFDFDFSIECYLPAAKRKFGYFALPLLWLNGQGDGYLAGKIDLKADRARSTLEVRALAWDDMPRDLNPIPRSSTLKKALAASLGRFADFNQCPKIEYRENLE